jgi:hypothetical protein
VALLGLIFHSYIIFCKVCWVHDKNEKVKMLTMSLIVVGTSFNLSTFDEPLCCFWWQKFASWWHNKTKLEYYCHRCVFLTPPKKKLIKKMEGNLDFWRNVAIFFIALQSLLALLLCF